jgi:hypothetical protein
MRTINLTVVALGIGLSIANAQTSNSVNPVIRESLGSINQCYHSVSQSNPCVTNSYSIAIQIIIGHWQAVDKPWTINFSANGVFDFKSGTIVMSTVGPPKSGRYRIETDKHDEYPTLIVDMNDGTHFKASIAMYGNELLLIDSGQTTTFHRS